MKLPYNRYFPTPSYLCMNSFAVDISDQSIKYGELIATSLGIRLGKFGKQKIPQGVVVSGKIEEEDKLIQILKILKEKENLNLVRVSLPEEQMYLFTLSLPISDDGNIRDMILLQIEEHIPLKAIDTIFQYDVISKSEKNLLVEVSAIASATVESYLSVFKRAGLTPISFELEAQAVARAVVPIDDKNPIMIVDFGDSKTGVSIVHDGRVFFTTTLDVGGVNLTNIIAKNFDISFEKAEEMKRSYGLDGVSNIEDIFPIILNGISVLRDDLNKQYAYWKSHEDCGIKHDSINRIILCGGDANLTGLADYLEASMDIRVEHANAWVNISDMKISVPSMSFEESLSYTTVLGLALGDFSHAFKPVINLLPENEKRSISNEYWKRFMVSFVSFCSVLAILAIILLVPSYLYSVEKFRITENKLNEFNLNNKDITSNNIDETIEDINKKLDLISSVKNNYSVSFDVIKTVLSSRTEGITYNQILFNERKDKSLAVEIHGKAKDRQSLRNFKSAIDKNPQIASSVLPMSDFLEKTDINFTISLVIK